MKVFIIAGEPSGDVLGARVLAGLRTRFRDTLEVAGLGGEHMAAEGLQSIFPISDVAVMGLVEVLRRYWSLSNRIRLLQDTIEAYNPDVLILIDAQGLSYRIAKHFAKAPFKKIQVVAPTVWAWKPERAWKIAKFLDHVACLFPFEPAYFEPYKLNASFVGHPALAMKFGMSRSDARQSLGILDDEDIWAAVLPGSRKTEILQHLPILSRVISAAYKKKKISGVVVPVASTVREEVRRWAEKLKVPCKVLESEYEKTNLPAADLAVAASGTVSLELSAQGIPTILIYRFNPITYAYIKRKLTINFMGLINLLCNAEIQPEFKLNECRVADLQSKFEELASRSDLRSKMIAEQYAALKKLDPRDELEFGDRVAALI